ncbi:MAG: LVIVD repeat-containing protein [Candidatus Hodarchaeota archaeon]
MRKRYKIFGIIVLAAVICSIGLIYYISENGLPGITFNVGYDVYVDNNYAYISNNDGIAIYDVTNPKNTKKVGNLDIEDGAFGIIVKDGIAYCAGDSSGFVIADVSDPKNPVKLGQYSDGGSALKVAVSGDFAYVTDTVDGLEIIDISNLSNPTEVGQFNGGGWPCIYVSEDIAYYGDDSGLKAINVSIPNSPQLISSRSNVGVLDIYVQEDLLFIASHQYGVRIYNISDPRTLVHLGQFTDVGESYGVSGNATHLYVADLQEGAQLLDISDPSTPQKIKEYTDTMPHDIFHDGEYIYLADQDKALIILDSELKGIYSDSAIPGLRLIPVSDIAILGFGLILAIVVLTSFLRRRKWKNRKLQNMGSIYEK